MLDKTDMSLFIRWTRLCLMCSFFNLSRNSIGSLSMMETSSQDRRFGVLCHWWFHYLGVLLHTELIVSLFFRCTMRCEIWAQPAELPSGRVLCLECRVSWVGVPPRAAHFSSEK